MRFAIRVTSGNVETASPHCAHFTAPRRFPLANPLRRLNGAAIKALVIVAIVVAINSISAVRIRAATLMIDNKTNPTAVAVQWAPIVHGGRWIQLPAVGGGSQGFFGISLPAGVTEIVVRANSKNRTAERKTVVNNFFYYQPRL